MKKAIIAGLVGAVLAIGAPSYAQGQFADVPIDHWAYEAVSQLQDAGIIIGYPDGTFSGKRALTRYEFAVALQRAIPVIQSGMGTIPSTSQFATKKELEDAIASLKGSGTAVPDSGDLAAFKKSLDEFRDELSAAGVDLDAVKRDVSGLEERVAAIEAEMKRLKITSKITFFALGEDSRSGAPIDADRRPLAADGNLLESTYFVRDADIIFNYEGGGAKATVVVNAGNYFNYLGNLLTGYTGTARLGADNADAFSLFLGYGEVPFLGGDVTVGRFPVQFTKWTLKKFDVDSYSENWKTEDGNYYVDGGKAAWTFGSVDVMAFAGKNDQNANFVNYVSRPAGAPYTLGDGSNGNAVGSLLAPVQSAGVRAVANFGSAKVGVNYLAVGEGGAGPLFEDATVWGADVQIPVNLLADWTWNAYYTESSASGAAGNSDADNNNSAWEVAGNAMFGSIGVNLGYKRVEPNFAAPGDWGLMGRWQNPVNIEGPEVGLSYAGSSFDINLFGAWYEGVDNNYRSNVAANTTAAWPARFAADAKWQWYKAGVNFALSSKGKLGLAAEYVNWEPAGTGAEPQEKFYTASYTHQVTDNTKLKLLYSWFEYENDGAAGGASPYGADFKGSVATIQASMDF